MREVPGFLDRGWRCCLAGILGLAIAPLATWAQGSSPTPRTENYYNITTRFDNAHVGSTINLQFLGITQNTVVWNPTVTTLGSCTLQVEVSSDSQNWTVPASGGPFTCTANGSALIGSTSNFLRVNVTALTGGSLNIAFQSKAAGTGGNVQGTVGNGGPNTGQNPVVIGLTDVASPGVPKACAPQSTSINTATVAGGLTCGFQTGVADTTGNNVYSAYRLPGVVADGPLAVLETFKVANSGINSQVAMRTVGGGGVASTCDPGGASSGSTCGGIFTAASGYIANQSGGFNTSTTLALWNVSNQSNEQIEACEFTAAVSAVTGVGATLDVFLQDSDDGNSWDDRAHLNQITATGNQTGSVQGWGITGTIHAYSTNALAAGTIVNGPLKARGRFSLVIAGTTPNFTANFLVTCR